MLLKDKLVAVNAIVLRPSAIPHIEDHRLRQAFAGPEGTSDLFCFPLSLLDILGDGSTKATRDTLLGLCSLDPLPFRPLPSASGLRSGV